MDDMFHNIARNPQAIIDAYDKVPKKHQNNPILLNYLSAAYFYKKDAKKVKETTIKNYNKNKDYLFAKINYAQICIEEEDYEKIPPIFNNKYELSLLYPKRKKFHIDEFIKFNWIMGVYFFKIGEIEKAKMYYEAIRSIEPRDKCTKMLKKLLYPSFLRRWVLKKLKQLEDKNKRLES